jgi:ubiquitin-conjugating enzyme E2 A
LESLWGIFSSPFDDDIMKWYAVIFGPKNTPWVGKSFKILLEFTEDYPNKPPNIIFCNRKIFHPNIYLDGKVCFDLLGKNWSPIYCVSSILSSIQSLLFYPNPQSPANLRAAEMFMTNRPEYFRLIQKLTSTINTSFFF